MDEWLKNTWIGVLLSSPTTRHEDLYKDGNDNPPKGKYPPLYALPANRESLKMVLFASFENAFFHVYQRILLLFHLSAENDQTAADEEGVNKKVTDKEESKIAADYKAGQREVTAEEAGDEGGNTSPNNLSGYYSDTFSDTEIDAEDTASTKEQRDEQSEQRNISTDSCVDEVFACKSRSGGGASPGCSGGVAAACAKSTTATHPQQETEAADEPVEQEAPPSPASRRRRRPGKLLMMAEHGTTNLEKQTQQSMYYTTGAALHEALALMMTIKTKGSKMTQAEIAARDTTLRANMSYVTAGNNILHIYNHIIYNLSNHIPLHYLPIYYSDRWTVRSKGSERRRPSEPSS